MASATNLKNAYEIPNIHTCIAANFNRCDGNPVGKRHSYLSARFLVNSSFQIKSQFCIFYLDLLEEQLFAFEFISKSYSMYTYHSFYSFSGIAFPGIAHPTVLLRNSCIELEWRQTTTKNAIDKIHWNPVLTTIGRAIDFEWFPQNFCEWMHSVYACVCVCNVYPIYYIST